MNTQELAACITKELMDVWTIGIPLGGSEGTDAALPLEIEQVIFEILEREIPVKDTAAL